MAGNKIYDGSWYSGQVDSMEETFMGYVNNNPGCTEAEIVSGTTLNAIQVNEMMVIMQERRLIMVSYDVQGQPYYWTPGEFSTQIWNNRVAARTWLTTNSGGDIQDLATDLGVHEAIATALAEGLRIEGLARIVRT